MLAPDAAQIEDLDPVAARQVRADEGVELAVLGDEPAGRDGDVGVEQPVAVALDQPGQDRRRPGPATIRSSRRVLGPSGTGLGQRLQFLAG